MDYIDQITLDGKQLSRLVSEGRKSDPRLYKRGVYATKCLAHFAAPAIDAPRAVECPCRFLDRALGAAYTSVTLDRQARVFALNAGVLTVLGR